MLNKKIIMGIGILSTTVFSIASASGGVCSIDEPSYDEKKCAQRLEEIEREINDGNSSPPNAPYVEDIDTIATLFPEFKIIG